MAFKEFETEEDYNKAINEAVDKAAGAYKGYLSPGDVDKLKADHAKELNAAKAKAAAAEGTAMRLRAAVAHKLPMELAERLVGGTEKEINDDAEAMAKLVNVHGGGEPPKTTGGGGNGGIDAAWGALLGAISE